MLTAGTCLGPYEILAPLGSGGMGEVYRARDKRLHREVAIKCLAERVTQNRSAVDRFTREAQAASALNHPNIITIHDIGESNGAHFIVMELVEGRTLRALAAQAQRLDMLVQVGTQVARALAVAHEAGIVHNIEPGANCRRMLSWVLWPDGHPGQALLRSREAVELARERGHHFTMCYALFSAAAVHGLRGEAEAASPIVDSFLALAGDQGFPAMVAMATFFEGWVLAERGSVSDGLSRMRQALTYFERDGSRTRGVFFRVLLADAYLKIGHADEGLEILAEASDRMAATGERFAEAELYRVKGELLLRQGSPTDVVEDCFHQALRVARSQGAKSWELRAATSLARLWASQGKQSEARETLSVAHDWFTEGHDTRDLREAKALLDELSAGDR